MVDYWWEMPEETLLVQSLTAHVVGLGCSGPDDSVKIWVGRFASDWVFCWWRLLYHSFIYSFSYFYCCFPFGSRHLTIRECSRIIRHSLVDLSGRGVEGRRIISYNHDWHWFYVFFFSKSIILYSDNRCWFLHFLLMCRWSSLLADLGLSVDSFSFPPFVESSFPQLLYLLWKFMYWHTGV